MIIPDKVKSFLSSIQDISIGYNEITFFLSEDLLEEQIGYRVDPKGNSLIGGKEGDWRENWLVIATDHAGDPIIVDLNASLLSVFSAPHGEGEWEPVQIADSLATFHKIISLFAEISKDRTTPVDLENHPITDKEKQKIISEIKKYNPHSEMWYCEQILED